MLYGLWSICAVVSLRYYLQYWRSHFSHHDLHHYHCLDSCEYVCDDLVCLYDRNPDRSIHKDRAVRPYVSFDVFGDDSSVKRIGRRHHNGMVCLLYVFSCDPIVCSDRRIQSHIFRKSKTSPREPLAREFLLFPHLRTIFRIDCRERSFLVWCVH